ncbi:RNA polymerase sigma24 factor [Actinoplanes philippinensis]|uniref:RNA polymerase sigma-70 factor, ECF subfamily n=1 Tax=Actinoplanes philippinensis TaxID=35752 RepID=A0A1I2M5C2_9ACTN|nr:RNA polymerase sigma factor [Actinoplanes philippinensis]GIE83020.1 RNA polymerase sigma24 factor [Actinoplanes philippinensis]SFF86009.1 RNA polymerase sigma-70 factor, ECF subfamily [Actinoplanes philippinensis]
MRASAQDDRRLLCRVAKGDLEAFEQLYRNTSPWLAMRLRLRCSDDGLVAEVVQDTYLTVWRAAGSFAAMSPRGDAPGNGAAGWLWTIAARRLVDAQRKQGRRRERPAEVLPTLSVPAAEDDALAGTVGDELGTALARLAPELRAVLRAMVLDGHTVQETSVLLGIPEGTVKSRARRARNAMREALS